MTFIYDDDDSDSTHAYDDEHSVLRLATVVCWLGQTSSPVDFCPTLPSLDWGRGGLLTTHGGPTRLALRWVCWGSLNRGPRLVGRRASPAGPLGGVLVCQLS